MDPDQKTQFRYLNGSQYQFSNRQNEKIIFYFSRLNQMIVLIYKQLYVVVVVGRVNAIFCCGLLYTFIIKYESIG